MDSQTVDDEAMAA
uniref:Uncharacterized protein n=1 Tax=Bos taurus TaxID=9913 RepID=A0AAA9S118_BOVIN